MPPHSLIYCYFYGSCLRAIIIHLLIHRNSSCTHASATCTITVPIDTLYVLSRLPEYLSKFVISPNPSSFKFSLRIVLLRDTFSSTLWIYRNKATCWNSGKASRGPKPQTTIRTHLQLWWGQNKKASQKNSSFDLSLGSRWGLTGCSPPLSSPLLLELQQIFCYCPLLYKP